MTRPFDLQEVLDLTARLYAAVTQGKHDVVTRIETVQFDDAPHFTEEARAAFRLLIPHMARALELCRQVAAKKKGGLPLTLSPRQREILGLAAQGLRSKEIAARLGLSVRTVEHHFTAAARQLKARGRSQAIATALDLGLIQA
jgi:DNA-binding NarL/FixJ family response regulator